MMGFEESNGIAKRRVFVPAALGEREHRRRALRGAGERRVVVGAGRGDVGGGVVSAERVPVRAAAPVGAAAAVVVGDAALQKPPLCLSISCVCPEPVLVN